MELLISAPTKEKIMVEKIMWITFQLIFSKNIMVFLNAKMVVFKKNNKQMIKYPNLREYYGPFFLYGRKQHEQGME